MSEQSFEAAVQTLKRRLSGHWESDEAGGRDEMVGALREELGYSTNEAKDVIDHMIEAGVLRYHHPIVEREGVLVPPIVSPIGVDGGLGATQPTGLAVPLATQGGYWQIGAE